MISYCFDMISVNIAYLNVPLKAEEIFIKTRNSFLQHGDRPFLRSISGRASKGEIGK